LVLTGQDFVAGLDDQFVPRVVQPPTVTIGGGSGFFQDCMARDHFAGDQIRADAEMLE
jgi:hypothetical protein